MRNDGVASVTWQSGVLDVRGAPGQTQEVKASGEDAREHGEAFMRLLGLLLVQAWHDGMRAIDLQANPGDDTVEMRYEGRAGGGERGSWSMSPPPANVYAGLVRAIVSTCAFDAGTRPQGVIHTRLNGELVDVHVELDGWYHARLSFESRVS